jgi:tetratricopeptide (TPR) repeat protein
MRLSPRDPYIGLFHSLRSAAELGLGHFDAAIDGYRKAIDSGFRTWFVYTGLTAAYAQAGKMDEAKTALAEARCLNPRITVKWVNEHSGASSAHLDGLRKAGLPKE